MTAPFPPGAGGGEGVARGYKGKGVLLHLLVDGNGRPIAITTTAANGDERREVEKLINQVKIAPEPHRNMPIIEADKGYDAQWLRQLLLDRGLFPLIPRRKQGKPHIDKPPAKATREFFGIKSLRWQVERAIAWLKRKSRRLMIRWERRESCWLAFAKLGIVRYWLDILVR